MIKKIIMLVFIFLAAVPLFSLPVAPFKPADAVFVNESCTFSTIIPEIPPNQVLITVQSLPEHVSFISSRKQEIMSGGLRSTELFVVLKFAKTGNYRIPSIPARIQYGSQYIAFSPVTVYDNPKNTQPALSLEFIQPDGTPVHTLTAGKPVRAVLYGMYFAGVTTVKNTAPVFGLLLQKEALIPLPYVQKTFTPTPIAIAAYEFIPFSSGKFTLQSISAELTTWAGSTITLAAEPKTIEVSSKESADISSPFSDPFSDYMGQSLFKQAFDSVIEEKTEQVSYAVTMEELVLKEIQHRRLLSYTSLICVFLCIILGLVWFMFRTVKAGKYIAFLGILLFLAGTASGLLLLPRYGVFPGGSVFTIPENESKASFIIEEPSVVRIHLETGLWTYITMSNSNQSVQKGGWVRSESLKRISLKKGAAI